MQLNIPSITTVDYPTRLSTAIAGSDLPDIIAVRILATTLPNTADFLNSACTDLTPYLSGDAVKDYPNLANLPSSAWPPTIFNNKIMAVPVAPRTTGVNPAVSSPRIMRRRSSRRPWRIIAAFGTPACSTRTPPQARP